MANQVTTSTINWGSAGPGLFFVLRWLLVCDILSELLCFNWGALWLVLAFGLDLKFELELVFAGLEDWGEFFWFFV